MKIIALSGPKHCGKSSVAAILGERLQAPCLDLDAEIKKYSGRSPRELFKESEAVFRAAEAETLAGLLTNFFSCGSPAGETKKSSAPFGDGQIVILALGGGIIDNTAAVDLLKGASNNSCAANMLKIICLEVSAETAWQRIEAAAKKDGELPPFLRCADPKAAHRRLHTRRAAAYRELANIVIDCENKSIDNIAENIAGELCSDSSL
jgi:shikimate kinase